MTQESRQHGILEKHDSAAECGAYTDAPERDFFIDAPERHYNADAPELDFYIDGPELDQTSSISQLLPGFGIDAGYDSEFPEVAPNLQLKRQRWFNIAMLIVATTLGLAIGLGTGLGLRFRRGHPSPHVASKLDILLDTSLVAILNKNGDRILFFQETSGIIRRAINRSREADSEWFTEAQEVVAENAKTPTPIAVIILPSNFSSGNSEEIYVFYINKKNRVDMRLWQGYYWTTLDDAKAEYIPRPESLPIASNNSRYLTATFSASAPPAQTLTYSGNSAFYLGYEGVDSATFQEWRYRLHTPELSNGSQDSNRISWEDQNITATRMANVKPPSTIGPIASAMLRSYWDNNIISDPGLCLVFWRKMPEEETIYLDSMFKENTGWTSGFKTHNKFNITEMSSSDRDLLVFGMRGELSDLRRPHIFWINGNKLVSGLSQNAYSSDFLGNEPISLPSPDKNVFPFQRMTVIAPPDSTEFSIYHQFDYETLSSLKYEAGIGVWSSVNFTIRTR